MDRVWSETPPLQSPQQAVEANGSSIVNVELCKTECPSPAISPGPPDPESPTGPPGPEAVPSYPTGAVAPLDGTEGLGVIRDLKSLNPVDEGHTGVEDRELVYQSLDRYPISVSNSYVTYAPNYTSTTCSPSPYSTGTIRELKLNNYQIGSTQSSVLLQGYESPQHSLVSTSPGGTSLHYGPPTSIQSLPVQYPLGSHSPVPNQQPMWSTLNMDRHNSGTPYGLVPDLGCTVLDPQDVNRSYVCGGGATYIPTPPPPGDGLWASYADKNQTLPSMSGLNYLQDRRAYGDPPEYIRMVDPPLHQCAMCGVTESSGWRKDTTGQFVCNNCGVYRNGARASSMRQQKRMTTSRRVGMTCSNCSTNDTTLWRRNGQGEPVCNACGLYYKLHQINRPISMRKDSIQTRKRKPKHSSSTKGRASSTHSANGSGRSKSPSSSNCTQGSSAPPTPVYMGQGNSEGGTRDDTSPSPMLPSSATLSQQMQHLGPIDPHPQDDPSSYLIHQGMDAHHSVISIGHKLQSLHGV